MKRTEISDEVLREVEQRERERNDERERALLDLFHADALARLRSAGVPERYVHQEEGFDVRIVPTPMREWAASLPKGLTVAGGILAGPPGEGKTTAVCWALRVLAVTPRPMRDANGRLGSYQSPTFAFRRAGDLVASIFAKDRSLDRLSRVQVLVVDDWGLPYEHDWPLSELDRLVDVRWSEKKVTFVTTNLLGDGFQRRYPRVFSRLTANDGLGVVEMNEGRDRRR